MPRSLSAARTCQTRQFSLLSTHTRRPRERQTHTRRQHSQALHKFTPPAVHKNSRTAPLRSSSPRGRLTPPGGKPSPTAAPFISLGDGIFVAGFTLDHHCEHGKKNRSHTSPQTHRPAPSPRSPIATARLSLAHNTSHARPATASPRAALRERPTTASASLPPGPRCTLTQTPTSGGWNEPRAIRDPPHSHHLP